MNKGRTFFSVFFIISFILFLSNLTAHFAGGTGTEEDPWQVETAEHLNNIRNYLGEEFTDKYYIQTADIDLGVPPWNEGEGWEPIGKGTGRMESFYGHYDGNGKVIDGLIINRENTDDQGLFGSVLYGTVKNLGITNVRIVGRSNVGSLTGRIFFSTVTNCYSTGMTAGKELNTGGLIGEVRSSTVINCYNAADVSGGKSSTGGLTGRNHGSTIEQCYNTGNISGQNFTGGLVGVNRSALFSLTHETGCVAVQYHRSPIRSPVDNSTIRNSYNMGRVTGRDRVGGLAGYNYHAEIIDCFSTGYVSGETNTGGLTGSLDKGLTYRDFNNYWDIDTSGQEVSAMGRGRRTSAMTYPYSDDTYVNWDFGVWTPDLNLDINEGYPYLSKQVRTTEIPSAASNFSPRNRADNVQLSVELSWEVNYNELYTNSPAGFRISFGSDNPPTNIADNLDLGRQFSFSADTLLDAPKTYYWRVVPYNDKGEAVESPLLSFTTVPFFADGSGTKSDPWHIETAEHLDAIRNYLGKDHSDKYFIMTSDINLGTAPWNEGQGWHPIGWLKETRTNPFAGKYDGNGHTIRGLTINRDMDYQGLFGSIEEAEIRNLRLIEVDITACSLVGGLAGKIRSSRISNCFTAGTVNGKNMTGGLIGGIYSSSVKESYSKGEVKSDNSVGGLAGKIVNSSLVDCHSTADVEGDSGVGVLAGSTHTARIGRSSASGNVKGNINVGGLIGGLSYRSELDNSYSTGNVSGVRRVGGLAGFNSGTVRNCFSMGDVTALDIAGGLSGNMLNAVILNSFSTGRVISDGENTGGLIGKRGVNDESRVVNSYWNIETSGRTVSALGEGRNTGEMTYPYAENTYLNWGFGTVWAADLHHDINNGYPYHLDSRPVANIPFAAQNPEPQNRSENIRPDLPYLSWESSFNESFTNPPDGFRFSFGTDNPPSNILQEYDLGNQNSFSPDSLLSFQTTYYWQVIPYNQHGEAKNNPVWTFTTGHLFAGGKGTEQEPWQIETAEQLSSINYFLGEEHSDKYYVQTANIELGVAPWNEEEGWLPIGWWKFWNNENPFTGNYDGAGHIINGLFIYRSASGQGLFGRTENAVISNLGLTNVSIKGDRYVGGLAGYDNSSVFSICYVKGIVHGTGAAVGGLIGATYHSKVKNCYASVEVQGTNVTGGLVGYNDISVIADCYSSGIVFGAENTGGLVGRNDNSSEIIRSYSTATVAATDSNTGGLVGSHAFHSVISNCYSRGNVAGAENTGGLIGYVSGSAVINSYSRGYVSGEDSSAAGLVGKKESGEKFRDVNNYWNRETSGRRTSAMGAGRTSRNMTYPFSRRTYVGWDFDDVWSIDKEAEINNGYPYLEW